MDLLPFCKHGVKEGGDHKEPCKKMIRGSGDCALLDHISELSEAIIHHILYFLFLKERLLKLVCCPRECDKYAHQFLLRFLCDRLFRCTRPLQECNLNSGKIDPRRNDNEVHEICGQNSAKVSRREDFYTYKLRFRITSHPTPLNSLLD